MNPTPANRTDAEPDSLDAFHALAKATRYYLDMLHACDPDMVDGIFHPRARLCALEAGVPVFRSVEEYKEVLRARTSPASLGAPREDPCLMLDLASPALGLVKVKMRVNRRVLIGYLGLIRIDEGWRIVSKTYYRLARNLRGPSLGGWAAIPAAACRSGNGPAILPPGRGEQRLVDVRQLFQLHRLAAVKVLLTVQQEPAAIRCAGVPACLAAACSPYRHGPVSITSRPYLATTRNGS